MLTSYTDRRTQARIELYQFAPNPRVSDGYMIKGISTPESKRRKGGAEAILKRACREADIDRVRLYSFIDVDGKTEGLTSEIVQTVLKRNNFSPMPTSVPSKFVIWHRIPQ